MKVLIGILIFLLASNSWAQSLSKVITEEQREEMASHNAAARAFAAEWESLFRDENPLTFDLLQNTKPISLPEYEQAGYLLFSSEFRFDSHAAKLKMAEELPLDVTLVIFTYTSDKAHLKNLRAEYEGVIAAERLKIVFIPNSRRGFWTRDGVPVPVWRQDANGDKKLAVVDARYYHGFEEDQVFADLFSADLTSHQYYYEGGNFLTNSRGECIIADNDMVQEMPDQVFKDHYGCRKLLRLPHVKGIGHIDESVKFMDDDTVVTDTDSYVAVLEAAGYSVKMLPRPINGYETYVNSLIVNGTVYVPIFEQNTDDEALQVYKDLGFKTVPLNSIELSNRGAGSIHCITMTYPPVEFSDLLEAIDAQPID